MEDLETDAVPDPPRVEVPPEEANPKENDSIKTGRKTREKEPGGSDLPPGGEKKPASKSSHKQRSSFNNPWFKAPGGANMINITNATNVHIGSNISVNIVGQQYPVPHPSKSPSPEPQKMEKPKDVKEVCKNTTSVCNKDLHTVVEHIGERWVQLGARLGYSTEQLERFHADHKSMGLKEVVYQMLLDWKQDKGPEAKVGILCHSLWVAGLHTAAKQLSAQHLKTSLS